MTSGRPTFEIAFVLAGAISAGCYSAGVTDFMIEALDDYYAERDKPRWDGPMHDVRVPVLAGASAGGDDGWHNGFAHVQAAGARVARACTTGEGRQPALFQLGHRRVDPAIT